MTTELPKKLKLHFRESYNKYIVTYCILFFNFFNGFQYGA